MFEVNGHYRLSHWIALASLMHFVGTQLPRKAMYVCARTLLGVVHLLAVSLGQCPQSSFIKQR